MSCRLGGGVVGAACWLGGCSWSVCLVGWGVVGNGSVSDSASYELWSTMGVRGGDTLVLGERGCD